MRLSWKDLVTTALFVFGAAIVYAKFYDFSWAVIESWRSAVMVLAAMGIGMFAFSSFDFDNLSVLNVGEMIVGLAAIGLAIVGSFMASEFVFYSLAILLGAFWLSDTTRHMRHSLMNDDNPTYHHHMPVH